jgi:indolepyruvate ferredoxin oxidoreductase
LTTTPEQSPPPPAAAPTSGTVEPAYSLEDRYRAESGRVFLSGIQALARIPVEQLRLDRKAGRRTAAFVSGYPGSPLGGFDQEMARARRLASDVEIVHLPAVNEELGATAVMGSQLAAMRPDRRYQGVVGVWYGKAPGLDRAGDALRHATFAGTSPTGGAVALVGDDPACKSSTMPSSSDASLVDLHMPILYPGTVSECLELGLHGIAMSRVTGLWSSLKIVTPIADATESVTLPVFDGDPAAPTIEVDGQPWHQQPSAQFLGPQMLEVEREFYDIRLTLAHDYGVLNDLNVVTVDPPDAWIGCIATGYTYHELREALRRLGLVDDAAIAAAGIRLLYLRLPVPFNERQIAHFARGLDEILVVEEKNPTLEQLVRDALYPTPLRPAVTGKKGPDGQRVFPSHGLLNADAMLAGLRARLATRLGERLAPPPPAPRPRIQLSGGGRTPFFCSGCPHNWGTKVPAGSVVGMGTGCHGMTLLMDEERVGQSIGITAMGNEGAHWLGMAPFVETGHVFQNLGDGTYFHSAQLSVQMAIAAKANMTFKLFYNSTVAMTGGQDASNAIGVPELAQVLLAQGAARVAITADDPGRYRGVRLPAGVTLSDRSEIVAVQEKLAAVPGVTVLIHDQVCATELRRARKRNKLPTPGYRVVINHRICEGCGDCGDKSNCLSVQPLDTPLGRKTQIDQETCNFDLSCLQGDCPAFMTVEVPADGAATGGESFEGVAVADPPATARDSVALRLAGIGGTGVVSAAQIIGTAAMLDGWEVDGLDQTGLSQKAGPVVSDLTLARAPQSPGPVAPAARRAKLVGAAQADLLLAFDPLVAASPAAVAASSPHRTVTIASTAVPPVGARISHPELPQPTPEQLGARLSEASLPGGYIAVDAAAYAAALTGLQTTANIFLIGVALQRGDVPVVPARLRQAIELNGVAVDANLAAFEWGRRWAADPSAVDAVVARRSLDVTTVDTPPLPADLGRRVASLCLSEPAADDERSGPAADVLTMLTADLVAYQDRAYAGRFLDLVERVWAAERAAGGSGALTEAVARGYHKLLAYKDEYEVARLMLSDDGLAAARVVGGDTPQITWHLHPPALRSAGMAKKMRFGPGSRPVFQALARGKRLRGTVLDPFGRTEMRRLERQLPVEYAEAVERMVPKLAAANLAAAVEIASLPDRVRGYEDLKLRRAAAYREELAARVQSFPG